MIYREVNTRRTLSRHPAMLAGVSLAALMLAGWSTGASAQAQEQEISQKTAQEDAGNKDVADRATGDDDSTAQGSQDSQDTTNVIVVTGRRAALQAADERKKRSETIIDSVVADDAGKLPDNSITEVLQRVSGVSIVRFASLGDPDHFSVQGSGIQVRGLTGVATRLNGREIFSANNGRSLSFADVTPELMAAVDVYKASTADLIEGGTGGQIDLRTKMPFDFDGNFHAAGTAELSMGDLAQAADPSASILLTDTFDTPIGRIGILGDYAYSQFTSLSQFIRVEPYLRKRIQGGDYYIPGGFDYGDERFRYRRTGIYGAIQWQPADSLTFNAVFFQSRYKSRSSDYGAQVALQTFAVDPSQSQFDDIGGLVSTPNLYNRDPATFNDAGNITSAGNKGYVDADTVTRDYTLSFVFEPVGSPFALRGGIQRVNSHRGYNRLDVFRDLGFGSGFGLDLSDGLPNISISQATKQSFADPANYFWSASMPHDEDNSGQLDTANLDAEYNFDSGFFRAVKVGARYADRTERDLQNGYNWVALGRGWNGDPQLTYANAAPGDVAVHAFKDFFGGDFALPGNLYFASENLVSQLDRVALTRSPPAGFCTGMEFDCSAAGPLPRTGYGNGDEIRQPGFILPDDQVNNRTQNYAAYALVRFGPAQGAGISGNVGARIVHFENKGSGYIRQNATTFIRNGQQQSLTGNAVPRSGEADFTRVLPSINLDYSPTDSVKIRGGYNITLDLPSFQALRASGSVGVATSTNPNSTPTNNLPGLFTNFTADAGNPLLKPTISNNFDLSFEYYGKPGTAFHIAPFYKHITDLPIFSLTQRTVTVQFADGSSETVQAAASDFINSPEAAEVRGVEIGGRTYFDALPGFLKGFGFEGNYTFIDSKSPGDVYRDINGQIHNDAPLVGLSRNNFNATLLYDRDKVSARLAYSWRSRYLQSTNSNGTNPAYAYYSAPGQLTNLVDGTATNTQIALPVYGDAYGQLDASIRFNVTEQFSFGVQINNLLKSTQRTLMGGYPDDTTYVRSWFQSDRRLVAGIYLAF